MKKVLIRAPLLTKSGYGEHARQIFQYLISQPNIEVKTQSVPWGVTPWHGNTSHCNGLISEVINRTCQPDDKKFDVSVQVILPNEWDPSLATYNIGVTAGVETNKCNPMWASVHCNKMDKIIVPSNHTKECFENSAAIKTPIHVVPEAYFDELLNDDPRPIDLNLKSDFNFLTIGVLTGQSPETDRKNLFYLVKWFVEEFKNDLNVGLVIKTNRGRETAIDKSITTQMLEKVLKEVDHNGLPHVYLLHGNMSRSEMNALYRHPKIKGYISATRGEGFGLPLLESSIAELPVLATNWSAHTEFLNVERWIKIDYDLVPINDQRIDNNIFMKNSKWAQPKEASVKKSMRKFYNSSTIPKKWAKDMSKKLVESHSMKSIMQQYDEVLSEILK